MWHGSPDPYGRNYCLQLLEKQNTICPVSVSLDWNNTLKVMVPTLFGDTLLSYVYIYIRTYMYMYVDTICLL